LLQVIRSAKVPIVKFDHRRSGISVDICVNNDSGITTGRLLRKYVREYPPLRPLTMVLKVFLVRRVPSRPLMIPRRYMLLPLHPRLLCPTHPLHPSSLQSQRRLNDTFSGGVGSFALATMIISFLQVRACVHACVHGAWGVGRPHHLPSLCCPLGLPADASTRRAVPGHAGDVEPRRAAAGLLRCV
jgi:hypothetical protein